MVLTIDFAANKMKSIRTQAAVSRQYFDAHEMRAEEYDARNQLEIVEFLLAVIDGRITIPRDNH